MFCDHHVHQPLTTSMVNANGRKIAADMFVYLLIHQFTKEIRGYVSYLFSY